MVYKLLKEYELLFDFSENFYKHFDKKKSITVGIVSITIFILSIFLSMYSNNPVFYLLDIIPAYLLFDLHKKEVNRTLKYLYNDISRNDFYKNREKEFYNKVKAHKIDFENKEQMDMLLSLIDNELNELRSKKLINEGITIGLFAATWIGFITYTFGKGVRTITEALTWLIVISFLIATALFLTWILKMSLIDSGNNGYDKLKRMKRLLVDKYLVTNSSSIA
ncbi:hypothetical protein R9X47_28605 [Wukongibacter baidiensis]|uniref:hypothetical protein n=1 Tax=Wukongibacter baidiensis TaxID=1723361 RepID=UPI003D7F7EFB